MSLDELVFLLPAYCAGKGVIVLKDDTGCRARLDSMIIGIRDSDFLEITFKYLLHIFIV